MLSDQANQAFENMVAVNIDHNGVLGQKTTLLAGLAAALALGCSPCIERFLDRAREAGITENELGAVLAVVMTVSAGRVRNQLAAINDQTDLASG